MPKDLVEENAKLKRDCTRHRETVQMVTSALATAEKKVVMLEKLVSNCQDQIDRLAEDRDRIQNAYDRLERQYAVAVDALEDRS